MIGLEEACRLRKTGMSVNSMLDERRCRGASDAICVVELASHALFMHGGLETLWFVWLFVSDSNEWCHVREVV